VEDAVAAGFVLWKRGAEFRALTGLQQRNIHSYLPIMIVSRRIRGKVVELRRPLLSRYLFVSMDARHGNQISVRTTITV
jgi:hypothetical protein